MNLYERYRRLNYWNKVSFGAAIATFIGLAITLISSTPEFLSIFRNTPVLKYEDDSIIVRISNHVAGEFHNSEHYRIPVEITNKLSHTLFISRIEASFFNPKVHELAHYPVGPDGSYFTGSNINPEHGVWEAHETKTFNLGENKSGPVFIPLKIRMDIFHSASTQPTMCEFIVAEEENIIYWTTPKNIDFASGDRGVDGLEAYRRALHAARQWRSDAQLAFIIPSKTRSTVQENGLFIHTVSRWSFLMKSGSGLYGMWISITADSVKVTEPFSRIDEPDYADFMLNDILVPIRIGTIEALRSADRAGLIYGNSGRGWWFIHDGKTPGGRHPIWSLPYLGEDYWDLYVDASNGDFLRLNLDSLKTGQDSKDWVFDILNTQNH